MRFTHGARSAAAPQRALGAVPLSGHVLRSATAEEAVACGWPLSQRAGLTPAVRGAKKLTKHAASVLAPGSGGNGSGGRGAGVSSGGAGGAAAGAAAAAEEVIARAAKAAAAAGKAAAVAENEAARAALVAFVPAARFAGRKEGFFFGRGKAGMGYHRDNPPRPAARPQPAPQRAGGGGRGGGSGAVAGRPGGGGGVGRGRRHGK